MESERRESMVFYDSFYESVIDLPAEEFKKSMCAILNYGLRGEKPDTSGIEKTIFVLVKPQIDKNNQRWNNAKKSHKNCIEKSGVEGKKKQQKPLEICEEKVEEPVEQAAENVQFEEPCAPVLETIIDEDEVLWDSDIEEPAGTKDEPISVEEEPKFSSFTEEKHAYGEFKNVLLTLPEKSKLISTIGIEEYEKRLDFFSSYLKRKPEHKSACHFIDMRGWVANAVIDRAPKNQPERSQQRKSPLLEFDLDEILERP